MIIRQDWPTRPGLRRFGRSESGQALAEFALVLPLLLLLIAGIVEFGRGWNIQQVVTDAAREGARLTVVQDNTVTMASVRTRVYERLAAANLDSTQATVSITPAADWRKTGKPMTVSVSIPYSLAFVGALLQWAGGSSTINIASHAVMRNE